MACPLCAGISAVPSFTPEAAFVEGFMLGVVVERAVGLIGQNVSAQLCAAHLKQLREIADKIPATIVGPSHRHLLSFGLSVVKSP